MTGIERRILNLEKQSGNAIHRQQLEQRIEEIRAYFEQAHEPDDSWQEIRLIVSNPEGNEIMVTAGEYDSLAKIQGWRFVRFG